MMVGRELEIDQRAPRPQAAKWCSRSKISPRPNSKTFLSSFAAAKCWASPDWWARGRSELGAALFGIAIRVAPAGADSARAGQRHRTGARRSPPAGAHDADERGRKRHDGGSAAFAALGISAPRPGACRDAERGRTSGPALPLPPRPGRHAQRRQSTEGAAGPLAAGQSGRALPGRPHARHRRRRQAGHLPRSSMPWRAKARA